MLVEKIMTSPCTTIRGDKSIEDALVLMTQKEIRHLPIVDEHDQLLGIISDRDIKMALPSILSDDDPNQSLSLSISKIMRRNVIRCHPLDFVEDIAIDFYEMSIGSIPVIRDNKVIGIVTQKDMLNTFLELTGVTMPGSIIEVHIDDKVGALHDITGIFKEQNIDILNVLAYTDQENINKRYLMLRIKSMNPEKIYQLLEEKEYHVIHPFGMKHD
ncbi:CBS and ACT domain-containing protein [Mammaliicoccus sp. Dog046]|uniref:CBS and ACT domain-containing protein n=1 Tax=Mammaliicoccus sp. Dog046 TaxID=3034233 RepID=UPI002B256A6B|nr:CBS and ACT domain-containing protein [Mammaliicoccus sp. Dog046]WQK86422.1 CBS and ACT domain-containing protein [Mammaliicoccus sp. Dog046]